ncbi:heat stress transcription factor [Acrasis kona]|uniref:Heat stress transcription factor n=1 Tax=Acrasis kona TaxID=1008807 RepID=A0AAW2ZK84_9EUKA
MSLRVANAKPQRQDSTSLELELGKLTSRKLTNNSAQSSKGIVTQWNTITQNVASIILRYCTLYELSSLCSLSTKWKKFVIVHFSESIEFAEDVKNFIVVSNMGLILTLDSLRIQTKAPPPATSGKKGKVKEDQKHTENIEHIDHNIKILDNLHKLCEASLQKSEDRTMNSTTFCEILRLLKSYIIPHFSRRMINSESFTLDNMHKHVELDHFMPRPYGANQAYASLYTLHAVLLANFTQKQEFTLTSQLACTMIARRLVRTKQTTPNVTLSPKYCNPLGFVFLEVERCVDRYEFISTDKREVYEKILGYFKTLTMDPSLDSVEVTFDADEDRQRIKKDIYFFHACRWLAQCRATRDLVLGGKKWSSSDICALLICLNSSRSITNVPNSPTTPSSIRHDATQDWKPLKLFIPSVVELEELQFVAVQNDQPISVSQHGNASNIRHSRKSVHLQYLEGNRRVSRNLKALDLSLSSMNPMDVDEALLQEANQSSKQKSALNAQFIRRSVHFSLLSNGNASVSASDMRMAIDESKRMSRALDVQTVHSQYTTNSTVAGANLLSRSLFGSKLDEYIIKQRTRTMIAGITSRHLQQWPSCTREVAMASLNPTVLNNAWQPPPQINTLILLFSFNLPPPSFDGLFQLKHCLKNLQVNDCELNGVTIHQNFIKVLCELPFLECLTMTRISMTKEHHNGSEEQTTGWSEFIDKYVQASVPLKDLRIMECRMRIKEVQSLVNVVKERFKTLDNLELNLRGLIIDDLSAQHQMNNTLNEGVVVNENKKKKKKEKEDSAPKHLINLNTIVDDLVLNGNCKKIFADMGYEEIGANHLHKDKKQCVLQ